MTEADMNPYEAPETYTPDSVPPSWTDWRSLEMFTACLAGANLGVALLLLAGRMPGVAVLFAVLAAGSDLLSRGCERYTRTTRKG